VARSGGRSTTRIRAQTGNRQGAIEDANWVLEHRPAGIDRNRVLEMRRLHDREE
jgi:hypothetical protein